MADYVAVSKEQAYAHSLRLFRAISQWKNEGATNMLQTAQDVLALSYFMIPSDPLLFAANGDQVVTDMSANLVAASAILEPDTTMPTALSARPKGPIVTAALAVIMAWLKTQGIENIVEWIIEQLNKMES